jgi:hypothetical protein
MTSQAIEGACALAWRNYLLLHSGYVWRRTRDAGTDTAYQRKR